jgi:hypothetical protein
MASAFREAYIRALPSPGQRSVDVARVASHTGRKSLAQWLWDAYGNLRLIADVGHWSGPRDAVNLYFTTSRATILRCIAAL